MSCLKANVLILKVQKHNQNNLPLFFFCGLSVTTVTVNSCGCCDSLAKCKMDKRHAVVTAYMRRLRQRNMRNAIKLVDLLPLLAFLAAKKSNHLIIALNVAFVLTWLYIRVQHTICRPETIVSIAMTNRVPFAARCMTISVRFCIEKNCSFSQTKKTGQKYHGKVK